MNQLVVATDPLLPMHRSSTAFSWSRGSALLLLAASIVACANSADPVDDSSDESSTSESTHPTTTSNASSSTDTSSTSEDGSSSSTTSLSESGSDSDSSMQDDPKIGEIQIVESLVLVKEGEGEDSRHAEISARFYDGHAPQWHRETARAGDCRLLQYEPGICDEICEGVCVGKNNCQAWPTYLSAGELSIDGLALDVTMNPEPISKNYYPSQDLPADLLQPSASIHASASGADVPAFAVQAGGVEDLLVELPNNELVLQPGADKVLTWTPATSGAASRIKVTLNANNIAHGQPYTAIIECEVDDAKGEVVIPASLIDAFPVKDNSSICVLHDCPFSSLQRFVSGVATLPAGRVEMNVATRVEFGLARLQ